jgi:hypothetical protein
VLDNVVHGLTQVAGDAASTVAGSGSEAVAIAAFAERINTSGGGPAADQLAGSNLHVAAAALLTRLLGELPTRPQPQLLADLLQLEAAVRGERLKPTCTGARD